MLFINVHRLLDLTAVGGGKRLFGLVVQVVFAGFDLYPQIAWVPGRPRGYFSDLNNSRCVLQDIAGFNSPTLEIGIAGAAAVTLKLGLSQLEIIIQTLREFSQEGKIRQAFTFGDRNQSRCTVRNSAIREGCLELGVTKVAFQSDSSNCFMPVGDNLLLLNKELALTVLGHLNSFIAHGSVRPVFKNRKR